MEGPYEEVVHENTPFEKANPVERPGTESLGANDRNTPPVYASRAAKSGSNL
jgi:hypothetical protein